MRTSDDDVERFLSLDGCFNFRDLGGYPTTHGVHIRRRRLFRADELQRLSAADHDLLIELGIATVIDLRTSREVEQRGRFEPASKAVSYHHYPMFDVTPPLGDLSRWLQAPFVAEEYHRMLQCGRDAVRKVLALLADSTVYPAVFHCRGGRDRTGVMAAVVLALLGVREDIIVADYMLSAKAMPRMIAFLREEGIETGEELDRHAPVMLAVLPDAMGMFLAGLRARYGSFRGYAEALDMGSATDQLRAILLQQEGDPERTTGDTARIN
jgi:protein-tyrosine phosphatase